MARKSSAKKKAASKKPALKKTAATKKKPANRAKKTAVARKKSSAREPVATHAHPCDCEAQVELGTKSAPAFAAKRTRGGDDDWRVAKSLLKLRAQVNAMAPNRAKDNDGTIGDTSHQKRSSDHNPWVDEGVVTAMDITNDPAHGCSSDAIAEAIRASRDRRVKYIIWNRRIANHAALDGQPAWAWRPYSGSNPHDHHVHVSVLPEKSLYDDESTWAI